MLEKIMIEVFGIKEQQSGGGCNCSGGCGPTKTMGQMYDEFVHFLANSKIRDQIDIHFIDILMDDMDRYPHVLDAMNQEYSLPLTVINGEIKFYGGISNKMIYNALRNNAKTK